MIGMGKEKIFIYLSEEITDKVISFFNVMEYIQFLMEIYEKEDENRLREEYEEHLAEVELSWRACL